MKTYLLISCILIFVHATTQAGSAVDKNKRTTENKTKTSAPKLVQTEMPAPKSDFAIPAKPSEGHDPFFPSSDRLFAVAKPVAAPTSKVELKLNGIAGGYAIISGHTFAVGEEATINTASGRVSVRCLEIRDEVAVVEINGQRRELGFQR